MSSKAIRPLIGPLRSVAPSCLPGATCRPIGVYSQAGTNSAPTARSASSHSVPVERGTCARCPNTTNGSTAGRPSGVLTRAIRKEQFERSFNAHSCYHWVCRHAPRPFFSLVFIPFCVHHALFGTLSRLKGSGNNIFDTNRNVFAPETPAPKDELATPPYGRCPS